MPAPDARLTRRQKRLLQNFSDGSEALFALLDALPDRRAPLMHEHAARVRSVLAAGERLLAGSGLRPAVRLDRQHGITPGETFVALLALHEALRLFLARYRPAPLEHYPRSPRQA
jgi:hypothetical protein